MGYNEVDKYQVNLKGCTFLKSNFSKITQQNFKVNKYSERTRFALLENVFTWKFCRTVFEKFYFKKPEQEQYGNGNKWYKIERITITNFINEISG